MTKRASDDKLTAPRKETRGWEPSWGEPSAQDYAKWEQSDLPLSNELALKVWRQLAFGFMTWFEKPSKRDINQRWGM